MSSFSVASNGLGMVASLLLLQNQIDHPAAADVDLLGVAAVGKDVLVRAAGVLKGVGEDRHAVEGALLVDAASQREHVGGQPCGVERDGAEGVPEDVAQS